MIERITLQRTKYIPKQLDEGILYYSDEYQIAAHLCPCGCGSKVVTPIHPTEWSIRIVNEKVTLYPSIGNWQKDCLSHYWIKNGKIIWAPIWSKDKIEKGRKLEDSRNERYYSKRKVLITDLICKLRAKFHFCWI